MKKRDLHAMTDEQLVALYADLSIQQGGYKTSINQYNRLYAEIHAISDLLRSRGIAARRTLLPLLDHENPQVQYNAARELLAVEPKRARATLETLARSAPTAQKGRAGMTLDNLDNGIFKPT